MRKDIALPGLALAGGAACFALRKWQLSAAFHPETGLFTHGAVSTYALLGATFVLLLLFLASLRGCRKVPEDFLPAFGSPEAGQMTLWAAAGLLMVAAGLVNLMEGAQMLQLWQLTPAADRDPTQFTLTAARLLCALLCFPSGAAVLLMGRSAYRWELPSSLGLLAPNARLRGASVALFHPSGARNGAGPHGVRLRSAAAALLMLGHYYVAGFLFGRLRPRRALFSP